MFEINALSCQHISIALEHPYRETMATIELDLTGLSNIKCNIFSMGSNYSSLTPTLSRIMQTCASIPVTVRALIKFWERENSNKLRGMDTTNLSLLLSQSEKGGGDRHSDGSSKSGQRDNSNVSDRNAYGTNNNSNDNGNGNSNNDVANGNGDIRSGGAQFIARLPNFSNKSGEIGKNWTNDHRRETAVEQHQQQASFFFCFLLAPSNLQFEFDFNFLVKN